MSTKKDKFLQQITIKSSMSIKDVLKRIDDVSMKILFVVDEEGRLIGSLSDGDIRRQLLKDAALTDSIEGCYNSSPLFFNKKNYDLKKIREVMIEKVIDVLPIVDDDNKIVEVVNWAQVFDKNETPLRKIDLPVVIMAGGKGERMGPFTSIFPKSLIPIGDKPMIAVIIERFCRRGINNFYMALNHQGEMLKFYFDHLKKDYSMKYIWEKKPLGTAGSLKLLPKSVGDDFFVSNCDIVVDADYGDLVDFHKRNESLLTIVGSIQHYKIPYGVINFKDGGIVKDVTEKPEYDFTVVTGLYLLSKKALKYIPKNKFFDMTDLIRTLLDDGQKVSVYPVSQNSYMDVGQWEEYKKSAEKIKLLV